MEVDDIQTQVSKFQRICCKNDTDSNKIANKVVVSTYEAGRLYGWPSSSSASRIVRVSRASGGKDRHSKVLTSKGLRDRRVRLSVTTAIQFYDLQDRLGYDQPSKAVEWLIKAAASSIAELPSLDPSFVDFNNVNNVASCCLRDGIKKVGDDENNNEVLMLSKSGSSSASETSKCSGLSLSRSENRIRARERARGLAASKKEKEINVSQTTSNSSFTDLLTGGGMIRNTTVASSTPMDYFQQFGNNNNNNCSQSQQQQHFSFLQENLSYATSSSSSGYNNNNRGTLQSNLMSNLPHHHHLQRFQPMVDGSTSTNFPFFVAPNMGGSGGTNNQFLATGLDSQQLRLYGGDGEGHYYDHHKDKSKS